MQIAFSRHLGKHINPKRVGLMHRIHTVDPTTIFDHKDAQHTRALGRALGVSHGTKSLTPGWREKQRRLKRANTRYLKEQRRIRLQSAHG